MPLNVAGKPLSNHALAVGGGLIVALVGTFLPWYTTVFRTVYGLSSGGHDALGYWSGWLFFLAVLVGIALFVVRNFVPQAGIPALPFTDAMIYAGLGVVMILCALLVLVTGGGNSDLYAQLPLPEGVSWGPNFGVFIGIIAAAAVGVGGYLMRAVPQPATKPTGPRTSNA